MRIMQILHYQVNRLLLLPVYPLNLSKDALLSTTGAIVLLLGDRWPLTPVKAIWRSNSTLRRVFVLTSKCCFTRLRAAALILCKRSGCSSSWRIRNPIPSQSPAPARKPVRSFSIISATPPTARPTVGHPHDMASSSTSEVPSLREVCTRKSSAGYISTVFVHHPTKWTCCSNRKC